MTTSKPGSEPGPTPSPQGDQTDDAVIQAQDKAIGPHIGPILFDIGEARGLRIGPMLREPACGNVYELPPERILALVVTEHAE